MNAPFSVEYPTDIGPTFPLMALYSTWQVREMRVADSVVCGADAKSDKPAVETEPSGLPLTPQALIDALIDIDLAYERKCKELSKSGLGATLQYHLLEKLRVQHRQEREPYVQQLIARQERSEASNRFPDPSTSVSSS